MDSQLFKDLKLRYSLPLMDLLYEAQQIHRANHVQNEIFVNSLINIKSGGCSENCSYCPQSVHNTAKVSVEKLMNNHEVLNKAKEALKNGASRICLGAAWREVRSNRDFDRILEMIRDLSQLNLEVCCTLGMINKEQAIQLKKAGLTAYNHNLDTSDTYYSEVISSREYEDRINTLQHAGAAGLSLCSGGIIGMGESIDDRISLIIALTKLTHTPESVPINLLVPVEGTPLQNQEPIPSWELIRMIALTRIALPKSRIRLSAGRNKLSHEAQTLCFLAGANSVFLGKKLLTTENNCMEDDFQLFNALGLNLHKN